MKKIVTCLPILILSLCFFSLTPNARAQEGLPPKFNLPKSGLELERRTQLGSFFDVLGRKSALFGYENRTFEAWVYPMKILDDFRFSFNLQGYPLDIDSRDINVSINVRPEATTFTYSHAAFTVKQILFAPVDEQGIIMLLDVNSVLPLTVTGWFRPKLRLMWPAGLMTGYVGWDDKAQVYFTGEETGRYFGIIGSPQARDISVQPYQEEPRDVPLRFVIETTSEAMKSSFIPIVIAGSTEGRDRAMANYHKLLSSVQSLYEKNVAYYKSLAERTVSIITPDKRLNAAFDWAKIGIDKGIVTNPNLGTGLVAGFRTSGDSERPGFAWFFGRDSMWTTLAIISYGDFAAARTAMDFLKNVQRADGKVPHEISQSAGIIDWFNRYGYAWASADATPLYIIAHGDYFRASGDLEFIKKNWESLKKAYQFTAATDKDGNGLIENTGVGHGWVEGGALYPPHEEIYMQGVWVEALHRMAEMAGAMRDEKLMAEVRVAAERTRKVTEEVYWLPQQGFYAFATNQPKPPRTAEPGPNLTTRQARINELDRAKIIDEDTVLPAVPMWWHMLDDSHAQLELDRLGSGAIATDWGARIISNRSRLYDPLSYHYGSVWPLFTGWQAMAAYSYGRPHIGYQALMANALLTYGNALGYVTELLSGDFNQAFGRSSHHQVWSSAMVVSPVVRGLFGFEAQGSTLKFAPQLPATWDKTMVKNFAAGSARYDISLEKAPGRMVIKIDRQAGAGDSAKKILLSPALPLDAKVRSVSVNGAPAKFQAQRTGDCQFVDVTIENASTTTEAIFNYDEGTDVFVEQEIPTTGAINQGLRILRSRAEADRLKLTLEGRSNHTYELLVRTPKRISQINGVKIIEANEWETRLQVSFSGANDAYVRQEFSLPMQMRR